LGKIGVLVNFIIEKLSQFSLVTGFLREREKIFYTYSGPFFFLNKKNYAKSMKKIVGAVWELPAK
jgi:hypothetical protein